MIMEYQEKGKYFAVVAGSLEALAKAELEELGATVLQEVPRGMRFQCDPRTLYRVVYCSRMLQRVLAPLASFRCHSEDYLYKQARQAVDWTALFPPEESFGIDSTVARSKISHSLYAGQLLKDAICDSFREKYGRRPDFASSGARIGFNLHISDNWATVSLDLTGSMHKRGYRQEAVAAPLQETLAAALVRLSKWQGDRPLEDPMCGSGTILAEALILYTRTPAAFLRQDLGITYLPDYDPSLWQKVKTDADKEIRPLPPGLIRGSDINPGSVAIARNNLAALPGGENVELQVSRFQDLPSRPEMCVICNPPYGVRLGDSGATVRLYNELGDFLKQKRPRGEAYVLCGSRELVPALRLRAYWKKRLKNGDLDVVFAKILLR
ncbi:MAG: class I SAM-dependent RNA methyltransferase [Candidatus Syntrophosphaera sp.]|nr:class I SAM-dependent RNA methyltransferase [Candidatus Syntrophosphaera sp.]